MRLSMIFKVCQNFNTLIFKAQMGFQDLFHFMKLSWVFFFRFSASPINSALLFGDGLIKGGITSKIFVIAISYSVGELLTSSKSKYTKFLIFSLPSIAKNLFITVLFPLSLHSLIIHSIAWRHTHVYIT